MPVMLEEVQKSIQTLKNIEKHYFCAVREKMVFEVLEDHFVMLPSLGARKQNSSHAS